MGSIKHNETAPLGLTSHLPITEERAAELAEIVATSMRDADGLSALCELLLGVAPFQTFGNLNAVHGRRIRNKGLMFDPEEVDRLLTDLWSRYTAVLVAVESLYTYTPEFARALEAYARSLHQTGEQQGGKA